jgi:LDH2 family malate/lactate/ureidoglycolate dehydrogenase
MVEVLSGILGGARSGPDILGLFSVDGPSELGQAFWAIDPAVLDGGRRREGFEGRLERLCDQLVAAPTAPGAPGRVLIPGEPEAEAERLADVRGVILDSRHHAGMAGLADRYGVQLPPVTRVDPGSPS